jgi:hypothetical protein
MTLLLALGLSLGGIGCAGTSQSTQPAEQTPPPAPAPAPTPPPAPPPATAAQDASSPTGKRQPLPGTCVAWAICRERMAEKDGVGPALKQTLYDQAREAYEQAIKIDPEHMPAYAGLARIYQLQKLPTKALETYHLALQKKPADPSLWLEVGMCHCRAQQWDLAIRSLAKALELDPNNRRLTQTLGFCQARAGRARDSVETLAKVMPPADANYNVARMMRHMQQDDQCRHYVQEALRLDAAHAAARALLDALDGRGALPAENPSASVQISFAD